MKIKEILDEVVIPTGLEGKQIDLSHWDDQIKDAYIVTLRDGRKSILYDDKSGRTNLRIDQEPNESMDEFRKRVKKKIVDGAILSNARRRLLRSDVDRLYLKVPFKDKEIAKSRYKARWDGHRKKWYIGPKSIGHIPELMERGWLE